MTTLVRLLQRAAAITRPYNYRDAIQLVSCLSVLHLHRPEVRIICEKVSFSLASSKEDIPPSQVVDLLNRLCVLQSASLPVVHAVLAQRLTELKIKQEHGTVSVSDARLVHSAGAALIKLGKRYMNQKAAEHVLRLSHEVLKTYPKDMSLRLAYIALFSYTNRASVLHLWWKQPPPYRPSIQTLSDSIVLLLQDTKQLEQAHGHAAFQLLHLCLVVPLASTPTGSVPEGIITSYDQVVDELAGTDRVSIGAYVQFLHDFLPDIAQVDVRRALCLLDGLMRRRHWVGRMNQYDWSKLAVSVSGTVAVLKRSAPAAGTTRSTSTTSASNSFLSSALTVLNSGVVSMLQGTTDKDSAPATVEVDSYCVAALLHGVARVGQSSPTLVERKVSIEALGQLILQSLKKKGSDSTAKPMPPTVQSWIALSAAQLLVRVAPSSTGVLRAAATDVILSYAALPSSAKVSMRSDAEVVYAFSLLANRASASSSVSVDGSAVNGAATPPESSLSLVFFAGQMTSVLHRIASRLTNRDTTVKAVDIDMLLTSMEHWCACAFYEREVNVCTEFRGVFSTVMHYASEVCCNVALDHLLRRFTSLLRIYSLLSDPLTGVETGLASSVLDALQVYGNELLTHSHGFQRAIHALNSFVIAGGALSEQHTAVTLLLPSICAALSQAVSQASNSTSASQWRELVTSAAGAQRLGAEVYIESGDKLQTRRSDPANTRVATVCFDAALLETAKLEEDTAAALLRITGDVMETGKGVVNPAGKWIDTLRQEALEKHGDMSEDTLYSLLCSNMYVGASRALFPTKDSLVTLLTAAEAVLARLVREWRLKEGDSDEDPYLVKRSSKLLGAFVDSQLFFRIAINKQDQSLLIEVVRNLSVCLKKSPRKADAVILLKMELLTETPPAAAA